MKFNIKIPLINFIFRLTLITASFTFFLILSCRYFAITGERVIDINLNHKSPYMSIFSPQDRLGQLVCEKNDCVQVIYNEPIYFDFLTSVKFSSGEVELIFKNNQQPIVEFGVNVGPQSSQMRLYPVKHQILESLQADPAWHAITEDGLILLQKEKNFEHIADFLNAVPYDKKIAFYNYDFQYNFRLDHYQNSAKLNIFNPYLVGSYNSYFYIGPQESVDLEIEFADLNKSSGIDNLEINIYSNVTKELVWQSSFKDDETKHNFIDNSYIAKIKLSELPTGTYRLEVNATDDLVTKTIKTKLSKFVIDRQINLLSKAQIKKYWPKVKVSPLTLYTVGKVLSFQTFSEDAYQTVKINNQSLDINERVFLFKNRSKMIEEKNIFLPERGLLIKSDNFLSFTKEHYFNLQPYNFRAVQNFDEIDFDYILARYQAPEILENGWIRATILVDLSRAFYQNRQVKFMISLPGIEERQTEFLLSNLKFRLKR